MPENTNPYRAPADPRSADRTSNETAAAEESRLWVIGFWIGVCCFAAGIFAVFFRNLPPSGFFLVAMILFAAISIGSETFRTRAIAGFFVCLLMSLVAFAHYRALQAQAAMERARRMQALAAEAAKQAAQQAARRAAESEFSGSE